MSIAMVLLEGFAIMLLTIAFVYYAYVAIDYLIEKIMGMFG